VPPWPQPKTATEWTEALNNKTIKYVVVNYFLKTMGVKNVTRLGLNDRAEMQCSDVNSAFTHRNIFTEFHVKTSQCSAAVQHVGLARLVEQALQQLGSTVLD